MVIWVVGVVGMWGVYLYHVSDQALVMTKIHGRGCGEGVNVPGIIYQMVYYINWM